MEAPSYRLLDVEKGTDGVDVEYHDSEGPSGRFLNRGAIGPAPPDHFCFSVFVCMCCNFIMGAHAIVNALKTRDKIKEGRLDYARETSADARRYAKIGLIAGAIVTVVLIVYSVVLISVARTMIQTQFQQDMPPELQQQLQQLQVQPGPQ